MIHSVLHFQLSALSAHLRPSPPFDCPTPFQNPGYFWGNYDLMEIANPMYDAVFKHLMDDGRIARLLLSRLTGLDIVSLIPLSQELVSETVENPLRTGHPLRVYRLDYSARVKDRHGAEYIIIVEIQREKVHRQDMRFRKYLGKQYLNRDFQTSVQTASGASYDSGIPILTIYFLGEPLKGFEEVPILLVGLTPIDYRTRIRLDETNSFLKSLFHEGIIINTRALRPSGGDELEALISIFNPLYQTNNPQIMSANEALYPKEGKDILERLHTVIQNKDVREKMQVEDDFRAEMQLYTEARAQELAQALQQKEEALHKQEEAERQKEEALHKQEEAERQKESAIQLLLEMGLPKDEIARKLGLSEGDMARY